MSIVFISFGCAEIIRKDDVFSPNLNDEKDVSVGDTFFTFEHKNVVRDPLFGEFIAEFESFRFDLTLVELGGKIGLQYSEYIYKMPAYPAQGGWLIKEGFNKRLDYAPADKVIRFKDYEFEILGVAGGQLKYRRIK